MGVGGKSLFTTISKYLEKQYQLFLITNQDNDYTLLPQMNKENIYYIDTNWYNKKEKKTKLDTLCCFKKFEKMAYKNICKILDEYGTENTILYAYEVNAVIPSKKASQKYHIPLVTRFQGTILSDYKNNLYYKIRKYPHIQAISTKSDLIIMTDDGTQGDKVLDKYENTSKRLFIKNGVNILDEKIEPINKEELKKKLVIPQESTILLTVSRLENWKRVERSIEALNELKDKDKYYLIVVGEGRERKNLENLAKKLKLEKQIRFTGAIKNEEVKRYMQLADIFLSFYDLSNVGNPLLEALCLGKPIITYDVGDTYKIINGKNGMLLQNVSPKNIAQNIEQMNHLETLHTYSNEAYKYAQNNLYSWTKRMQIEMDEVEKLFD